MQANFKVKKYLEFVSLIIQSINGYRDPLTI